MNDQWLNAVYIEDVLKVLIVAERSQSAPLNDVDCARWELPAFLIIHCCPFECLQTVYKPLVNLLLKYTYHLSLSNSHSSQKRKRCPRWYIRVVGIVHLIKRACLKLHEFAESVNTDLMNMYIYIYMYMCMNMYESQVFPNQFSKYGHAHVLEL